MGAATFFGATIPLALLAIGWAPHPAASQIMMQMLLDVAPAELDGSRHRGF